MKSAPALISVAFLLTACQPPAANPELAATIDRQAIEHLVAGEYPHALDSRNWQAYADTYTEDGELLVLGQSAKGRPAIIGFLSAQPAENRVVHVISNLRYDVEGNTATGGAYWQDIGMSGDAPGVLAAGHYEDTLRKINGEWKFAKRSIVIDFAPPNFGAGAAPASE